MPKEFRSVGPGGGLVTHDVPGLPQTQLRQPGKRVLRGLAEVAIGCESRTVLERAGRAQSAASKRKKRRGTRS